MSEETNVLLQNFYMYPHMLRYVAEGLFDYAVM